jgi:hypothetical protein
MKNLIEKTPLLLFGVAALLFVPLSSHAACSTWNMEGTYENRLGDRFKIVQPNCSTFKLIDLGNQEELSFKTGGVSNTLGLIRARSLPAELSRAAPVQVLIDESKDDQRPWLDASVTFKVRLKISKEDREQGLSAPELQLKLAIFAQRGAYSGPNPDRSRAPEEIFIGPFLGDQYLSVDVAASASPIQKAFSRGLNYALKMVQNYIGAETQSFYDHLTRVKD